MNTITIKIYSSPHILAYLLLYMHYLDVIGIKHFENLCPGRQWDLNDAQIDSPASPLEIPAV